MKFPCTKIQSILKQIESYSKGKIDAFMQDSKDACRILAGQLESQLQNSWDNLQRVLSDYHNSKRVLIIFIANILTSFSTFISGHNVTPETINRKKCYETIKEKDEKDQQVLEQQCTRTTNLFDEIRKLRSKITAYDVTAKKNISEILMEHNFFQNIYCTMKNRLLSGEQLL